jgi:hypothetical protein
MQTRLGSFIESVVNIIIGLAINVSAQMVIFPFFDIHIVWHDNILIAMIFTAISLTRSYVIRRFFNRRDNGKTNHAVSEVSPASSDDKSSR